MFSLMFNLAYTGFIYGIMMIIGFLVIVVGFAAFGLVLTIIHDVWMWMVGDRN